MERTESGARNGGAAPYRFGDIVVDPAAHALLRAGVPQPVEPKAFAVLLALLQRPGELIGRDDLLDQVWGHRHVTPGVLTRVIAQLRHALDEDPQHPRYIQTRHALGYCFIGQLEDPAGVVAGAVAGAAPEAGGESPAAFPPPPI
ncbi:MAG: winged helix-turn-helix domain-containing protein, partial [Rhodanobacter sp.]